MVAACDHVRRRKREERFHKDGNTPTLSVLKPLAGPEPDLESNLESFFDQRDAPYELVFAASSANDPALTTARSLAARHPSVRTQVIVAGKPPCPNAKVHSLAEMTRLATGDILAICDSDIRADRYTLRSLARAFIDPNVGAVTCPYRAVAGGSFWSRLEALGMNTEFWGGVLAARLLAPMDFAVGPTMAVRRARLEEVGGWKAVEHHLAEDFQLGRLVRRAGHTVELATHVVDHRIGSQGLRENLEHRLRWRRSTRRSRPVGYFGEIFAIPLPWALVLPLAAGGSTWAYTLAAVCVVLRFAVALAVGMGVLRDRTLPRHLWMLPLQDALSLALWFGGLAGTRIVWRGRTFELDRDGRLRPTAE